MATDSLDETRPWERQFVIKLSDWHPQQFNTFNTTGNELVVKALQSRNDYPLVYLWGASGTGKTHLLQAICNDLSTKGKRGVYLDLSQADDRKALLQDSVEIAKVNELCLDNVHAVAGTLVQEQALFMLVNQMIDAKKPMTMAGVRQPLKAGFLLEDLTSRMGWGPAFLLQSLSDEGKRALLESSAKRRGVVFPEESLDFLLRRARRDLKTLMLAMDRLDEASISERKERLSIPFLKRILAI